MQYERFKKKRIRMDLIQRKGHIKLEIRKQALAEQ